MTRTTAPSRQTHGFTRLPCDHPLGQHEPATPGDPTLRNGAEPVITMYVVPGTSNGIQPEDVIRSEGETDEAYAEHQALAVELWSILDREVDWPS